MILIDLFISFFKIGLFSFGGGYAALPLIFSQAVETHGWLSPLEFTDLVTISQMTPGPIAINAATFVGTRMAGLPGAIVATLGNVAPCFIIVSIIAYIYFKYEKLAWLQGMLAGLRPVVVALIASAGVGIVIIAIWGESGLSAITNPDLIAVCIFAAAFFVLRRFKLNPIMVMSASGVVGAIVYTFLPL